MHRFKAPPSGPGPRETHRKIQSTQRQQKPDTMCDFHSIVVRKDGAKAHVAANSHSEAVAAAKWRENQPNRDPFFNEVEWGGVGKFPGVDKITRGEAVNERQAKVIENHYTCLAQLLADPAKHAATMCLDGGIFAADEYADVRWKVLIHPECPKRVADKIALTPLHADGSRIKSLHPAIKSLSGYVSLYSGATLNAPVLAEVKGYVSLYSGATLNAPVLASAGDVSLDSGATLNAPVLAEVKGYVSLYSGATLNAPVLASSGDVSLYSGATLNAPVLAEVKGYVRLYSGATLNAPVLAKSTVIIRR